MYTFGRGDLGSRTGYSNFWKGYYTDYQVVPHQLFLSQEPEHRGAGSTRGNWTRIVLSVDMVAGYAQPRCVMA